MVDIFRICSMLELCACILGECITPFFAILTAVIAQLGERKTEDLKVSGSIPDCGILLLKTEVFK